VTAIALATRKKHASFRDENGNRVPTAFKQKFKRRFSQWWQIQGAVFIGLLPLTLFFFQQASIVTLLANFIAIPVIASFVVPLILLALVCLSLNLTSLSVGLLTAADRLVGWLWPVLQTLSEWPFSIWESASPALWTMLVCMTGTIILLTPALGKTRVLGALGFLPLFLSTTPELEPGSFKLHMLDVGQGLAVVVETQGHALLHDAGIKYPSGFDSGSAIVLPFLRQKRISHLDAVVASHDNLDHSGGLKSVLAEHPTAKRYASAAFYPLSEPCRAGMEWQWEGVNFTFLHPMPDNRKSDNNDSCVLKVESGFGSALLTGDIEHESEQNMLQNAYNKIKDTDVLLMPHHGSKTSSTTAFIDAVKPQLAIVSAGFLNRFKHPHEKSWRATRRKIFRY
jgi:competence protein ComEC